MTQSKSTENAIAGFQQMFELIKNQKASWINYVNLQNQGENFDIIKLLKSAFFMQAIANKQTLIDYYDCIRVKDTDLFLDLDDKFFLLYEYNTSSFDRERLYITNVDTIIFLKNRSNKNGWFLDIYVLTFDRSLLEDTIKPLIVNKGKNV